MERLATTYLGLELKNPIIVGSSPLTSSVDKLKKCEDAGAGAVVVKSIFEEQIDHDAARMIDETEGFVVHTDGQDFLEQVSRNHYIDNYLSWWRKHASARIRSRQRELQTSTWLDYVDRFEQSVPTPLECTT